MRKTITMLAVAILSIFFVTQSTAQKAYYLNFKDGSKQVFYTDFIDSIRVSNIGTDEIDYGFPVVQEFWANGEAYRYNISEIDSIVFRSPVTKLQPNVVDMKIELFDYLVAFNEDDFTLTFSHDLPETIIPKIGTLLVCDQQSDVLPIGFMGEVHSIDKDNDGNLVLLCSHCSFTDIYENYCSENNSDYALEASDGRMIPRRNAPKATSIKSNSFLWSPYSPLQLSYSLTKGVTKIEEDYYDINSKSDKDLGFNWTYSLAPEINIRTFILVENGKKYIGIGG